MSIWEVRRNAVGNLPKVSGDFALPRNARSMYHGTEISPVTIAALLKGRGKWDGADFGYIPNGGPCARAHVRVLGVSGLCGELF